MENEVVNVSLEEAQQAFLNQMTDGQARSSEEWEDLRGAFDSVNKALAEQRKAENEKARIEAESARAAKDAEVAEERSKRDLIGNCVRALGQVGAAGIAGFVSIVTIGRILDGEDHNVLAVSKAIGFVLKPRG